jgi:hypothetical protein
MAFLRGAGGVMPPTRGMMTGPPNAMGGGMPAMGMGMSGDAGGQDDGQGQPLPPELMQMQMASAILPQVLAQQQTDYYKKFLGRIVKLTREFMRARGIGPKTVSHVAHAVTGLQAAIGTLDKEDPEDAGPVGSLLASSLMQTPPAAMARQRLNVMGPLGQTQVG